MTSSAPSRILMLVQTTICLLLFASTCKYGRAHDDHHSGVLAGDFVPEAQGEEGHHPDLVFTQALECLNDEYIYKGCDEACRLTRNGELKMPHEYTDEYCDGPCLKETGLVLDCIEQISKHFRFMNKASVEDVRETIKTGCGYGPRRGDFDVAKHVRLDEGVAIKLWNSVVYATLLMIMAMGWHLLF